jgi:hypothetical protein
MDSACRINILHPRSQMRDLGHPIILERSDSGHLPMWIGQSRKCHRLQLVCFEPRLSS